MYAAGGVTVRIGRRSAAMDALLIRHGARIGVFVTAWNPMSRRMPVGWNNRMQRALTSRLRFVPAIAADGVWRDWHEAHLLAFAPLARGIGLARRFRQRAVVVVRVGAPVRLVPVSVTLFRAEYAECLNSRLGAIQSCSARARAHVPKAVPSRFRHGRT